tara:strand:- start:235 stop:615 length:381 start_codon:yes stop_codon:yes gene_type:complete
MGSTNPATACGEAACRFQQPSRFAGILNAGRFPPKAETDSERRENEPASIVPLPQRAEPERDCMVNETKFSEKFWLPLQSHSPPRTRNYFLQRKKVRKKGRSGSPEQKFWKKMAESRRVAPQNLFF